MTFLDFVKRLSDIMLVLATKKILIFIFSIVLRLKVEGLENIPKEGAVVIAPNHKSNWDPFLISVICKRYISFMAKESLFKFLPLRLLLLHFGNFPVKRDAPSDLTAMRTALSRLKDGKNLGIFPEGARIKTESLGKAEPGAALILTKSGAPVIPVAVINTEKIFKFEHGFFPEVKIIFGKPFTVEKMKADKEKLDEIGELLMSKISELRDKK